MIRVAACGTDFACFLAEAQVMFPDEPVEQPPLKFVTDQPTNDNHDWLLVFNNSSLPDGLTTPKTRVLGFALEPQRFLYLDQKVCDFIRAHISRYIMGKAVPQTIPNSEAGFSLIPSFMHQSVPPSLPPIDTRLPVSICLSNKQRTLNHRYRHDLAKALLLDPRCLPVHLWGRGVKTLAESIGRPNDPRVKGPFQNVEPYLNYKFTVAIENSLEGHYFTEKISLPVYCGCTPLYLGSPEIERYFPGAAICMSGDISRDVQAIANVCAGRISPRDQTAPRQFFQREWHWGRYLKALVGC